MYRHQSLRHRKNSFSLLAAFIVVICSLTTQAQTTYYVASNGSDGNDGRSTTTPIQSLDRVNNLPLQAGDQVLFRRGDTFRGTLILFRTGSASQPVVIDAYGSGTKPVLSGAVPVTNWTSLGNNIWQASASALGNQVTGVYSNGTALPLGRYPNLSAANRGYLTVQSHSGNGQLTGREALPTGFTGGEVVVRPTQWILDRATITQQNGNTLNLNNGSGYSIADGFGFFIQNHPATLDQTGEWYYNPGNKTLRIYDEGNPNTEVITATAFKEGVSIINAGYFTLRNLTVTQTINTGVLIENGTGVTLSGVDIINSGEDALSTKGNGSALLIENGLIDGVNNNGISINGYQNVTFRGNTLRRVGIWPGRGKGGDGTYIGFNAANTYNVTIENNVVDQIGYNGINFTSGTVLRRNRVSNYCLTKSDGGGLYIWNGNRSNMNGVQILNNIVFNGIGAPEGTPGGAYSGANGIFLDDCTTNVEVRDNTVFNCPGLGFFLHGSIGAQFSGNTSYNNGEAQFALNSRNGGCSPSDNLVQNNVLVSRLASQLITKYESHLNDLTSFGQFDNNVYARPFDDKFNMRAVYNNGSYITGADLSLSEWQSRYGKDLNSTTSPVTYKPFSTTGTGVVKLNSTFTTNNDGWDVWSPNAHGIAAWDNANHLDGGSLRVAFSDSDPYVLASKGIGSVVQNKTYLLTFDAVASGNNKHAEVFIRQRNAPYNDLDSRATILVNSTRQHYELSYSANAAEGDAIVIVQISDDGQSLWLDNVQLQEATRTPQNPDDFIRLEYNDTAQDKVVALESPCRDGHNKRYVSQITLSPFTSAVLFKETGDIPPPAPPVSLRDPENPANAMAGLNYSYYEGIWGQLPDFSTLTPVKTGYAAQPDLSQRNRDSNYGLQFKGYVAVPTDGFYTFYVNSDDGSKLLIGSTEVATNDGGHAEQERGGSIGLKAGQHAITIPYFQGGGGQALSVSYSGPGISKQIIPASAFYRVGGPAPPVIVLRDPENPANAVVGLDYSYYEGSWSQLPDFSTLTAVKSGQTGQPDLSPRNREEYFGLAFTGYVNIPADGQYTFYTSSDDGSKLLIGTTQVVDNDGGHAEQERSGTIGLKAGKHAISIPYVQGNGGKALSVSYSGPSFTKQTIPASAFYRLNIAPPPPPAVSLRDPDDPANAVAGLDYGYYEGSWSQLPDFSTLTAVKTGQTSQPDLTPRNREEYFGLRFTGYVNVPTDGVYTFYTSSDDGSKFYIGTTEVATNDGSHGEQERSGTIGLKAGKHAISIPYMQGNGGKALSVSYSGPNLNKQIIPASAFFRTASPPPPPASLRDPENPANAVVGLDYSYYEGSWSQLPDFSTLTAVKSGQTGQPDLSPRNREEYFGLAFTGYVNIPADGQYTFYTSSDDGSKLLIGTTQVVDNDGGHAEQERSGTIGLKAGKHAITIPYMQGNGGKALSVSYSSLTMNKQLIPAAAFYRIPVFVTPSPVGTGTGLRGEYFNNKTLTTPSVLTRTDATIDFDWGTGSPAAGTINVDNFSARWTGQVEAPVSGNYVFTTIADDGARLWVNGVLVIDDWNDHAPTTDNSAGIALVAGQKYSIRLEYYESAVGAVAHLLWTYPGQNQQVIPQLRLYPAPANGRLASPELNSLQAAVAFPIPAHDELQIRFSSAMAGEVSTTLVNEAGRVVQVLSHTVVAGENTLKLSIRELPRGMHLLTLTQETQRQTWKVLLSD